MHLFCEHAYCVQVNIGILSWSGCLHSVRDLPIWQSTKAIWSFPLHILILCATALIMFAFDGFQIRARPLVM